MLMTLNQLTGLPVVWQGSVVGQVDRGVMDDQARQLLGLIIRHGLGAAKWVTSRSISLIGQRCVVTAMRPLRLPQQLPSVASRVYLPNGSLLGQVTDALLCRETQRVQALEISESLMGHLMGRRRYAMDYQMGHEDTGKAVVSALLSWAELMESFKEERE